MWTVELCEECATKVFLAENYGVEGARFCPKCQAQINVARDPMKLINKLISDSRELKLRQRQLALVLGLTLGKRVPSWEEMLAELMARKA